MRRISSNPLTSWLCLLAFAANVLLQVGLVICSDGQGGSRLEWACSKNGRGECVACCTAGKASSQEDQLLPHPCDDKPLTPKQTGIQAAPRQANQPAVAAPVLLAVIDPFLIDLPGAGRAKPRSPLARAPDTVSRLRSVIMTV